MSKLEKGASYPGLEIIARLAAVLEVEPAELRKVPGTQGSSIARVRSGLRGTVIAGRLAL
jgi:transcriptional regulator with XRE-family HTH domain